jgi:hypothetical protein
MLKPIARNRNPNMTEATLGWFNEIYNPGFPSTSISPFQSEKAAGHYTQVNTQLYDSRTKCTEQIVFF